jgi:GT2 family glycosyltransferase
MSKVAMPVPILELDLARPIPSLDPPRGCDAVFAVVRFGGRVVGKAFLSPDIVRAGGAPLGAALEEAGGEALRRARLHAWLGWSEAGPLDRPAAPATVAVCTRDRPKDLRRCLEAIRSLPDDGQEVLVVDNAPSSEEARDVVRAFSPVRYVREERPGLNRARNRAVREAAHPVVAFADDDTAPEPLWLRALVRNFEERLVYASTGLALPAELETEAQVWQERLASFSRGFMRRVFDSRTTSPPLAGHAGAGASMAIRRKAIDLLGPFDEALDAGTRTRSGGDTEMFARILAAGYRIAYDPEAVSRHRHKSSRRETRSTLYGYGAGCSAVWTRLFLFDRETAALGHAARTLLRRRIPALARSLLRIRGSAPADLVFAELQGSLAGPQAYLIERWRRRA